MRACIIAGYGEPDQLEIRDVPDPVPAAGEVLVRVRATALNRADLLQRRGKYPAPAGAPALIPGLEFAGEVVAAGAGSTRWAVGDRVLGIVSGGAHAELVSVDEGSVVRVPDTLGWPEAGGAAEAFVTAHDALVTQAGLQPGERVLIHAIGSGVGLAAAQIARALGARVFGTARTPDKIDRAREFGLDSGHVAGSDMGQLVQAVDAWSDGQGVDVIADLVGGPYVEADVRCAAARGRILLIGAIAGASVTLPLGPIMAKRLAIRGTVLRARPLSEKAAVMAAFATDVLPMLADGRVRVPIDTVLPFDAVRDAHALLEGNTTFGKVVLTL